MKKILSFMLLLIILIVPFSSKAAEGTTVYIEEMDLSVVIPSEFDYFTRQVKADDHNLNKWGFTRDSLLSEMKAQEDYLVAFADGGDTILEIAMFASTISDFSALTDSALQQLAASFSDQYAKYGVSLQKYDIYSGRQTKFIKMYMYTKGNSNPFHTLQYTTSNGKKMINFTIRSYSGSITSSQESALKSIADSAIFGAGANSQDFGAQIYKDEKTGLQLTIPNSWEEYKPSGDDGMNVDATFFPAEGDNFVGYVSDDLWGTFSAEEKSEHARLDVNNDYFSTQAIASAFEVSENKVKMVTYGGKQYYFVDQTWCTRLIHVENGYLYMFQYYGTINDKNYKGFESIMQSVKYPGSLSEESATTTTSSESSLYRDSKTGMEFKIPSGWKETSLSKKGENYKAMFVSTKDPELSIIYGYYDVWNELSEEEKSEKSRGDINMSSFSEINLSKLLNTTTTKIEKTAYAGKKFYRLETYYRKNGTDYTTTTLYHVANGYVYQFSFSGKRTNQFYQDFESLLQSVNYKVLAASATSKPSTTSTPIATITPTVGPKAVFSFNQDMIKWAPIIGILLWALIPGAIARKKGRSFVCYYLLSLVITPLLTMIITICLRNRKVTDEKHNSTVFDNNHKEPSENSIAEKPETFFQQTQSSIETNQSSYRKDAPHDDKLIQQDCINESTVEANETSEEVIQFCRYCGFKLLEGSDFCSHCGKRVR